MNARFIEEIRRKPRIENIGFNLMVGASMKILLISGLILFGSASSFATTTPAGKWALSGLNGLNLLTIDSNLKGVACERPGKDCMQLKDASYSEPCGKLKFHVDWQENNQVYTANFEISVSENTGYGVSTSSKKPGAAVPFTAKKLDE
jgi:hypothetical protein